MLWNLLLGVLFLGANKYGDYITDECPQAGYACPSICDVDHIHLPRKECKNGKTKSRNERSKRTREINVLGCGSGQCVAGRSEEQGQGTER